LVFGGAFQVICQRRDFERDLCGIVACSDVILCRIEMRGVAAIDSGSVFSPTIRALFVYAVGVDDFKEIFD